VLPITLVAISAFTHASTGLPGSFVEAKLPVRPPSEVGMSGERLKAVDRVIQKGLDAGGYPGATLILARQGYAVVQKGYGRLGWDARSPATSPDSTLYDLASLTKVVATTTAIMILFDEGKLGLDDRVSQYLPEFKGGDKGLVTIEHLLTHYSGLPAGRQLWLMAKSPAEARSLVIDAKLNCKPGRCFTYSDLGPDILGFVVEKITGKKFDQFVRERVLAPLSMTNTMFKPAASLKPRIAPTATEAPRGHSIWGEVHDESAFALGGVTGHAGLFSSAADLAVFAQMMLNRGSYNGVRIVAESTVALFTRRTAGTRALGWDTANGEAGAGQFLSDKAYGHAGYTGTSLWIDPEREMFVVFLTNRVHAPRVRQPGYLIADVRNDLMDAAVVSVMDMPLGAIEVPSAFRSDTASYWNARTVRRGTR
jgi:CubicO group peptidase (beta-lactamase class C family)